MSEFNFVFLVGKKVLLKLDDEESHIGKIKQVFDDFIVLEDDANTHMIRKTRVGSVIVSKENNKTITTGKKRAK